MQRNCTRGLLFFFILNVTGPLHAAAAGIICKSTSAIFYARRITGVGASSARLYELSLVLSLRLQETTGLSQGFSRRQGY
jgi:hypothetical protein